MNRGIVAFALLLVIGLPLLFGGETGAQGFPIKHVIVLMQENRTFDHYFGTYPGVDGIPDGARMPVNPNDPNTAYVEPFHLSARRTPDPPHDERTARMAYDSGKMDGLIYAHSLKGFNAIDSNGLPVVMGYYDYRDIPYYWNLAEYYVLADRFFSSVLGGSFSNHLYLYAGSDNGYGSVPPGGMNLPTLFDRLEAKGVPWKNYVQNYNASVNYMSERDRLGLGPQSAQLVWAPLLGISSPNDYVKNQTLNSKIQDLSQYFVDINTDSFPSVAYISPSGQSEHAPSDISRGQLFAISLITALMTSPHWTDSVFILTYDDWGGWYDHVAPPQVDSEGYSFRVPALIISPYSRDAYIDHTVYDFTSILSLIENLFGLPPVVPGGRDSRANNLLGALDFKSPPRPPVVPVGDYPMRGGQEQQSTLRVWLSYAVVLLATPAIPIVALVARRRISKHVLKQLD